MTLLERLHFSIPISIHINAPADLVWETLTDIPNYVTTLSSVLKAEPIANISGSGSESFVGSGGGSDAPQNDNIAAEAATGTTAPPSQDASSASASEEPLQSQAASPSLPTRAAIGSKWKITRISVLERQEYSAKVTVTQYSDKEEARSFTMSTHQMLGATCSLKLVVEPVQLSSSSSSQQQQMQPSQNNNSNTTIPPAAPPSNTTIPNEACRVTAIMTMIPYQFFVKLFGVMCCLCLLKYRARMAMECDLEDVADYCEGRVAKAKEAEEAGIATETQVSEIEKQKPPE